MKRPLPDPAWGVVNGAMRRVVVSFDDETFAQLRALALKQRCSFAAVVRERVEWGLDADSKKEA